MSDQTGEYRSVPSSRGHLRVARARLLSSRNFSKNFITSLLHCVFRYVIFHCMEMKVTKAQLVASRDKLIQQIPDPSTILPGSLLSRMVRCNKPGCRFCENGKGHGPIVILTVSLGDRKVRQVQVPDEMMKEVEESLRAFAQTQDLLKQIAAINLELLRERKRKRQ
ncbi:MAG TPA: DUF6788 family protein [Terracidiphilus sp.]